MPAMPQKNHRPLPLLVLSAVAILTLLLLAILFMYWTRPISHEDHVIGFRATSSLRMVIVVTRHGNRSPIFTDPSNPYQPNNTVYWPYGPSQLTTKGRIQLHRLGRKIRSMYNIFLDDKYNPEDFQALSTSKGRTLMSAQLFTAGLFPPKDYQVWDENLLWQPVPIYTNNFDHTEYLEPGEKCPRFRQLQLEMYARFKEDNKANLTALYEYVSPYTGLKDDVYILWDTIKCADREGFPLPTWTQRIYPTPLTNIIDNFERSISSATVEMARLLQGQQYQEIVRLMEAKANDSLVPNRNMFLFSGHDITIRVLATILGIDLGIVSTGSALVLELHRLPNSTRHYVEVVYIDGASENLEPSEVNISVCGTPCPLDILLNSTKKYYNITDHKKECHNMKNIE